MLPITSSAVAKVATKIHDHLLLMDRVAERIGIEPYLVLERTWLARAEELVHQVLSGEHRLVAGGVVGVVRTALENAVSVAGVLLLTEATMTDVAEKKDDSPSSEAA